MTSILFLIETVLRNQRRCNYLKNMIFLQNLFLNVWTFQQKMTFSADVFQELRIPKNVVRSMSKKSHFTGPFVKQYGKRAKLFLHLFLDFLKLA